MSKEIVSTPNAPAAIGPYSQAVICNGMVYCSGQIGMDLDCNLVEGGVGPQTTKLMNNLKAVVEASGSNMNKVVKCTVLLADMSYFAEVNAIYATYFSENPPARACFAAAGLPKGALVEVECICHL